MKCGFVEHGQPIFQSGRDYARLTDRVLDELHGICRGVIMDGIISQGEAEAMIAWLKQQHYAQKSWPADVLLARLHDVLADGQLDTDEAQELLTLIHDIVGGCGDAHGPETSALPLDNPQPAIVFPHRRFVVTGRFASGSRKTITEMITGLGGNVAGNISLQVDYLVCGHFSSRDWIHSNMGRKIEAAAELRNRTTRCTICGCKIFDTKAPCPKCGESDFPRKIAIVSEAHWFRALSPGQLVEAR